MVLFAWAKRDEVKGDVVVAEPAPGANLCGLCEVAVCVEFPVVLQSVWAVSLCCEEAQMERRDVLVFV